MLICHLLSEESITEAGLTGCVMIVRIASTLPFLAERNGLDECTKSFEKQPRRV